METPAATRNPPPESPLAGAQVSIVSTSRGPVELAETGDGPAVLALHGAMGGWDQSLLLARTLIPPGHRVVALSRPGYLGTPLAVGRSPEAQAEVYAEVLRALGLREVVVVAVSGGGPSALALAAAHPELCRALVLVSTCGTRVTSRLPLAFQLLRLAARWRWLATSMERKAAAADPDTSAARSIPDAAVRARTLADPEAGPLFRSLLASTRSRMADRLAGTLDDVAVSRSGALPLDRIRVPTLVVHGTADRLVPFEAHGRVLARSIAGAELAALEGGDHVAIFTHLAEARARVAAFLAREAQVQRSPERRRQ
jgi:pimeloyl-ACP methyl ester carboxylesterase